MRKIKKYMKENPFIITERIIPKYFCDREKETALMVKLLTNGNNIVLISQRRIGKTGLIQYCYEQEEIKDNFITIYVDILSTSNLQEFTYLLGKEIFDSIRSRGEKIWRSFLTIVKSISGKIGFDNVSGLPSLNLQLGDITSPEYTLKEIFQYISKASRPCIVAIDEFQQINRYPERNVEALLRSHLLQINNCRMIFSGSERHMLSEMFLNSSKPFYMSASFLELSPIPKEIYVSFIRKLFEEGEKEIPEEMAIRVYDLFDGITFYIQRVCNGLYANTETGSSVTDEILHNTLDEILYSFDTIFRMRLSQLTTRQKELLFAIAKARKAENITSKEFIVKNALSTASAVQTALKALMKNGLVVKLENAYLIEDRFFQMWLVKSF